VDERKPLVSAARRPVPRTWTRTRLSAAALRVRLHYTAFGWLRSLNSKHLGGSIHIISIIWVVKPLVLGAAATAAANAAALVTLDAAVPPMVHGPPTRAQARAALEVSRCNLNP